MRAFVTRRGLCSVAVAALAFVAGCTPTAGPTAGASGKLVALGDSFTANSFHGPTVSVNGCTQSSGNQPHNVATRMNIATLVDVSCDGATTADILGPGNGDQPQINYVTSDTDVVLIGVTGNDIGFSDIVKNCATKAVTFQSCRGEYVVDGVDAVSGRIATARVQLDAVIAAVEVRAPGARVFVYGYPTLVPMTGTSGCFGLLINNDDFPWLREKQVELNAMISAASANAGVHFIDVFNPSFAHDPCASSAWVARTVDLPPVHPTSGGMDALGNLVADAVEATGAVS